MNHIESAADRIINNYFKDLASDGYKLNPIQRLEYHYEFSVAKENEKVKIQVYFGKKGVKTILQGDQTSNLYKELFPKFNSVLFSLEQRIIARTGELYWN